MTEDAIDGSGNLFRDLGLPNPELRQLKALLAAQIIRVLDDRDLTARQAQVETGVAAADFSRIRHVNLTRFTIDRLMTILDRLGQDVDVVVTVQPRRAA
jgi:predicted XRE-type DNA-binding protein